MTRRLTILKGVMHLPEPRAGTVTFDTVKSWATSGAILRHVVRYDDVVLRTYRVELLAKPLLTSILIRILSRGRCVIEDEAGVVVPVSAAHLTRSLGRLASHWAGRRSLIRGLMEEASRLEADHPRPHLPEDGAPLYLRTDLVFGIASGGSITHIAGVLNHLGSFVGDPIFLTSDLIATVDPAIETHVIAPDDRFIDFWELPSLAYNDRFQSEAERILRGRRTRFVYHRYATGHLMGARLARDLGVPFVLEYNGSEIWMHRNWGRPLKYEGVARRVEDANLAAADLIVVVSNPMRIELEARGVDPAKILVDPNGVDTERYAPSVDGAAIRERFGLSGKVVLGFIGTFGPWHGAEVLAEAFGILLDDHPELRESTRLFMIGDGPTLAETQRRIEVAGVEDAVVFAGRTAQADGPAYLAACDILVSPHVPNADGSPFFGSPTKLFEYMAMGKPIIASDLDQIGEVLDHGTSAVLVSPGDAPALSAAMSSLIEDVPGRMRLGENARDLAVVNHTWREHTRRITAKLEERCG